MTKVSIRPAIAEDWQVIQKLNSQVFENDKGHVDNLDLHWPFSEVGVTYYQDLCTGSYGHCLVAVADQQVVGYVALAENKLMNYMTARYLEIENIGVDSEYRSQGIGRQLIAAAEQYAADNNIDRLYVSAFAQNTRALAFYRSTGFTDFAIDLEKKVHAT